MMVWGQGSEPCDPEESLKNVWLVVRSIFGKISMKGRYGVQWEEHPTLTQNPKP